MHMGVGVEARCQPWVLFLKIHPTSLFLFSFSFPVSFLFSFFLTKDLLLAWDSLSSPGYLANKPQEVSVSTSAVMKLQVCDSSSGFFFYMVLGTKVSSLRLHHYHFNSWALFKAQSRLFLITQLFFKKERCHLRQQKQRN